MNNKKNNSNLKQILILVFFIIIICIIGYISSNIDYPNDVSSSNIISADLENIPDYSGNPYIEINNNIPFFNESDYTTSAFEQYSELDNLGRCGVAYANICKEIMPANDEERESLYSITPSGWQQATYEGIVEGNYLYNRCHLIAHNLAGENANQKNLITGTRYMNVHYCNK